MKENVIERPVMKTTLISLKSSRSCIYSFYLWISPLASRTSYLGAVTVLYVLSEYFFQAKLHNCMDFSVWIEECQQRNTQNISKIVLTHKWLMLTFV